jgi:signal transduction histidine kinase/DNA-binding LacI/PurR family transcriptional regulator/CheY-like chemotaxis protein
MDETMIPHASEHPEKRKTLGCIGSSLEYAFHNQLGLIHAAQAEDFNLVIFSGGLLEGADGVEPPRNIVFELAGPENVDGLFIDTDHLGHYAGQRKIAAFCARYHPLPVVNNGPPVPGVPRFDVGHYRGMYQTVSHLLESHHLTSIAFIRGPQRSVPASLRYKAYQDALRDHGVSFDERLVVLEGFGETLEHEGRHGLPFGDSLDMPGRIDRAREHEGVAALIDDRGLRPGVDFQAVVGTNDWMAAHALKTLRERGVAVPQDVAVVGFDDALVAQAANPPLTSADLPHYEMGVWAVKTLSALLHGGSVPENSSVPINLVIRESCGCRSGAGTQTVASPALSSHEGAQVHQPEAFVKLFDLVDVLTKKSDGQSLDWLLQTLVAEALEPMEGTEPSPFLNILSGLMESITWTPQLGVVWQTVISTLQTEARQHVNRAPNRGEAARSTLDDLCRQARSLIDEAAGHAQVQQHALAALMNNRLLELNNQMATAGSIADLMAMLAQQLPDLDIPAFFLVMFENSDDPLSFARLLLACDRSGRIAIEDSEARFPTRQLLPQGLLDPRKRHTLIVHPLCYHQERWGYLIYELGHTYGLLYETLRGQICSTLKRIQSQEEAEEARRSAEEANRMKSRFLTTVSHELRTPLAIINSLSDALINQSDGAAIPESYQRELEVIYATSEHLKRLVLDVLDLGRTQLGQLELTCKILTVQELLNEILPLGKMLAEDKGLAWKIDIEEGLPPVWGDKARLHQVILNLLSNACKFTSTGEVTLCARAGDGGVTISISDTGVGVPTDEQTLIFDEFSQSGRTAARGYGGMGLGLALSRRLVALHRGTIGVQSSGEEDAGATFSFTLPIPTSESATSFGAVICEPGQSHILILSDDGEAGKEHPLFSEFERQGLKVITLRSHEPDRFFEHIRASPPRVIVLDCKSSTHWAIDLAGRLKDQPATRAIPVLLYRLLSGQEQRALLDFDYLPKPIGCEALAHALVQHGIVAEASAEPPKTVLLVDDEPAILQLHRRRLLEVFPGCRVLVASNGRQAMDQIQQHHPDLILLDLLMPEMDGFAVLETLRGCEATRGIPVIVLTGQVLSEDVLERLNQGVDGILSKGIFTVDEIVDHVRAALSREKRRRSTARTIAERAAGYLQDHYAESITRGELAHYVGVDARYLTSCFHQELGMTPTDYVNRCRIWQAKRLLAEGQKNITEIALDVGFNSSAYFSRVFRTHVGLSPREFQQSDTHRLI